MNVSPHLSALVILAAFGITEARACAVATSVQVENRTARVAREAFVSEPARGLNQLPATGLAPGQAARVTLPSCLGVYAITIVFADGVRVEHPGLNAATIRGLELR